MSVAQVIVGLGGIAYPICIEKMMRMYGFRGKSLILIILITEQTCSRTFTETFYEYMYMYHVYNVYYVYHVSYKIF